MGVKLDNEYANCVAAVTAAKASILDTTTVLGVTGILPHGLNVPTLPKTVLYDAPVNTTSGWTTTASTIAVEAMNLIDNGPWPIGQTATPVNCLTMVTADASAGSLAYRNVTSMDVTNALIAGSFYLRPGVADEASDWVEVTAVQVRLYSGSGTTKYRTITLYNGGPTKEDFQFAGWHHFGQSVNDYCADTGAFDPTDVQRFALRIANTSAKTPLVAFASVQILAPMSLTKGIYSCWIDNAYDDAVLMTQYIDSLNLGIKATVSVVSSRVGSGGYATLAQVLAMQAAGHVIVNHTYDHTLFDTMRGANVAEEYERSADWMRTNGLGAYASVVSVPGSKLPQAAYEALINRCDAIFHVWDTNVAHAYVPSGPGRRRLVYAAAVGGGEVDMTAVDAALARAIGAEKCCAICVFHDNWDADSGTNFKAHMDAVAAAITAGTIVTKTSVELLTSATLP